MLLAADMQNALQAMRRPRDDRVGVAADKGVIGQHGFAGSEPLLDRDIGRLRVRSR